MLISCFFLGGKYWGARYFWGDPYLNSNTVLFDMNYEDECEYEKKANFTFG